LHNLLDKYFLITFVFALLTVIDVRFGWWNEWDETRLWLQYFLNFRIELHGAAWHRTACTGWAN